jgi:hypothetical protein
VKTQNPPAKAQPATWAFRARFRRDAFGWRGSKLAIERINEVLAEIRAAAHQEFILRALGVSVRQARRVVSLRCPKLRTFSGPSN